MRIYSKYVKAKERALGVFSKARTELKSIHDSLLGEHATCSSTIKLQVEQQQFLEGEIAHVYNSIQAITKVIGDKDA